jgi:hypothetical protein
MGLCERSIQRASQARDLPDFFSPIVSWNVASIVVAAMPQELPDCAGVSFPKLECGRISLYCPARSRSVVACGPPTEEVLELQYVGQRHSRTTRQSRKHQSEACRVFYYFGLCQFLPGGQYHLRLIHRATRHLVADVAVGVAMPMHHKNSGTPMPNKVLALAAVPLRWVA